MTDTDAFHPARQYAAKEVAHFIRTEAETGEGPFATIAWWKFGLEWVDCDDKSYVSIPFASEERLVLLASVNLDVRKILLRALASQISAGICPSGVLGNFTALALCGLLNEIKPKPGIKPSKNWERNLFIIETLKKLQGIYSLFPTRNDNPSADRKRPPSGSELVAEAFTAHGRHEVTVRAVREVWSNKRLRKLADEVDECIDERRRNPPSLNALAGWAPAHDANHFIMSVMTRP